MGAAVVVRLLAWCLVAATASAQTDGATWQTPKFIQPPDNADFTFTENEESPGGIIINLNEHATPIIALINYAGTTMPKSSAETDLKIVYAWSDADNMYTMAVTGSCDYDNGGTKQFDWNVQIGDEKNSVTVNLVNINDNPPQFINQERSCKVEEYVGEEEDFVEVKTTCSITVRDADGDVDKTAMTVLENGETATAFEVRQEGSPKNGKTEQDYVLYLVKGLDYEEYAVHVLNIRANDGVNETTISYVVDVIDLPDTPPVWDTFLPSMSINEKDPQKATVVAHDGDISIDADISYKLEAKNAEYQDLFAIGETDGVLEIGWINRDELKQETFEVLLTAYETDDPSSLVTQDLVVIVKDVNDNIPNITATSLSTAVNESYSGTFDFGITIEDPDLADNGRFSIALEENEWSDAFLVVPASGYQSTKVTISVLNPASLDYENIDWRTITLTVVATEEADKTHVTTRDFIIELNDTNDEFPEFTSESFKAEVSESADLDYLVTTISATDKDEGDQISYRMVPSTQLQVDELSGEVTVKRTLDYETTPELILQLTATDLADHRAYAELVVTIIDVNDEAPDIEAEPSITNVTEVPEEGKVIAQITASDQDTAAVLELSIDWDASSATKLGRKVDEVDQLLYTGAFEIETIEDNKRNVMANLVTTGYPELDWGKLDTIYLVLVAHDTTTDQKYLDNSKKTVQMTITIDDKNNNAPVFSEVGTLSVKEEEADLPIAFITAVDADGPGNNDVTYSISGELEMYDGYVTINSVTGEIRTIKKIDCDKEGYANISLVVKASDGELDTTKTISISVIDINDNGPVFEDFDTAVSIPERSDDGTEILQIIATDADITEKFSTIRYQMQNTDDNQLYFAVDSVTGVLSVRLAEGKVLRREDKETFTIDIVARDNYIDGVPGDGDSNSNLTTIIVTLEDINDNAPEFLSPDEVMVDGCFVSDMGEITEEVLKDQNIGEVKALDTDAGENGTVSYSIVSITDISTGEEPALFTVDEDSGIVTAAVDLLDLWGEYEVLFKAVDLGSPPLTGNITYTFCVKDVNNHKPSFVYPEDGDTIRLRETQRVGSRLYDWQNQPLPDFEVTDEDDPSTGNGQVTVTVTGGAEDIFTIGDSKDKNKFQLLLLQPLSDFPKNTSFDLQLTAMDGGVPVQSRNITLDIKIITITEQPPIFSNPQWTTSFPENSSGINEIRIIPEATDPNNENLDEDDQQAIYYYIVGGDEDLFQLNNTSRELKLNGQELDYEDATSHTIYVLATNSEKKPEEDPALENNDSVLKCIIQVTDVNDMPPEFENNLIAGGFTIDFAVGTVILTVKATDPDLNDVVTYRLYGDISASTDSLTSIKDNALLVEENGDIVLNFEPQDESLDGFFSFEVRARDSFSPDDVFGHYADAEVQVHVISNIHRVTFQFLNNRTYVESTRDMMEDIFSDVFQYDCGIESTKQSVDPSSGLALADSTDVVAHFVDAVGKHPVERDVITRQFYEQDTFIQLQSRFWIELNLNLKSYQEVGSKDATNIEGILTIILIVVSAVLGTMVIVLFVAFFLRTKTLKRRLEALQELKFGSQNSGLNRVGVAVPNTNKHAVEGSNPMWRTEAVIDYDNVSQSSGDSDMIGIEDNPEFQPSKNKSQFLDGPQPRKLTGILNKEFTFHPDDSDDKLKTESQYLSPDSLGEGQQPRRITETLNNNFILQYDNDANDLNQKTQSVNPLANGNLTNTDNYEGNDNFSFKPTESVPVTQL
ncbi:cadherin-23-like [Schistocerca nitens]|uniref:cadherin-23-like n=1 Tax=Schistocerca nitens TaxID=7011 RepID=UPI002118C18D|nr:cadherin-23-like [Schistocerca nitens]